MAVNMVRENSSVPAQLRAHAATATMKMFRDTVANGGTTVSLDTFKVPAKTDGYFVGKAKGWNGKPIESVVISAADFSLATLRRAVGFLYAEHLTREELEASKPIRNGFIGTWQDDSGNVHVDAVNWTSDRSEAVRWGLERGELAVYDVASNGSLYLSGAAMEMVA